MDGQDLLIWGSLVGLIAVYARVAALRRQVSERSPQRAFTLNINARAAILSHPMFARAAGIEQDGLSLWRKSRKDKRDQVVLKSVQERCTVHLRYLPGEDAFFVSGGGGAGIIDRAQQPDYGYDHRAGEVIEQSSLLCGVVVLSSGTGELCLNVHQRVQERQLYLDVSLEFEGAEVDDSPEPTLLCSIPFDRTRRLQDFGFEHDGTYYKKNGVALI